MVKQAVIIRYGETPIYCSPITTFQSAEDFAKFEKECEKNFEELFIFKSSELRALKFRTSELYGEIDKLKAELKFIKGEISEEEYTKLIGEGE